MEKPHNVVTWEARDKAIAEAVAAEREACAKIAESYRIAPVECITETPMRPITQRIAEIIRARGDKSD